MTIKKLRGIVDVLIIAVRTQDEIAELEKRFPISDRAAGCLDYCISEITRDDDNPSVIAMVRCGEGPAAAQQVMNTAIDEISPDLTLTVGIGGGVPRDDLSLGLGDVVISSGGLDVSRGELLPGRILRVKEKPFSLHSQAQKLIDSLRHIDENWATGENIGISRPNVDILMQGLVNVPEEWVKRCQGSLTRLRERNRPMVHTGTIASGGYFVKDELSKLARNVNKLMSSGILSDPLSAVDMETIGVHNASERENRIYAWISIRGISDMVGLLRDNAWSAYAAATAASFAAALLRARRNTPRSHAPRIEWSGSDDTSKANTSSFMLRSLVSEQTLCCDFVLTDEAKIYALIFDELISQWPYQRSQSSVDVDMICDADSSIKLDTRKFLNSQFRSVSELVPEYKFDIYEYLYKKDTEAGRMFSRVKSGIVDYFRDRIKADLDDGYVELEIEKLSIYTCHTLGLWFRLREERLAFIGEEFEYCALRSCFLRTSLRDNAYSLGSTLQYLVPNVGKLSWNEIIEMKHHSYFDDFKTKMSEAVRSSRSGNAIEAERILREAFEFSLRRLVEKFRPDTEFTKIRGSITEQLPDAEIRDIISQGVLDEQKDAWMLFPVDLRRQSNFGRVGQ